MPVFKYKAKNISGKTVKDTVTAENHSELSAMLVEKQLFLIKSKQIDKDATKEKLTDKELAEFSREVGTMLSAGISLSKAIAIFAKRDIDEKAKKISNELLESIESGFSLSESMKSNKATFPELFINMIVAGEASGNLDKTFLKMADYYEKESRMRSKLKNAMTYPAFLLSITVIIVIVIFTFVLPNFLKTFENMELPLPTRIMMAISNALVNYWPLILIILFLLVVGLMFLFKQDNVKNTIDKSKLRIPKLNKFLKILYTARFARTLCALYSSGVPLVSAVDISCMTVGNRYIVSQIRNAIKKVESGVPLSSALANLDGFDSKLASIILIGEETGKLAEMLSSVSDSYEYDSEIAVQRMLVIIEPLLLVFMALIIGSVLLAVMLPILRMYQGIGI